MTVKEFKSDYLGESIIDINSSYQYKCYSIKKVSNRYYVIELIDNKSLNIKRINLEEFVDRVKRGRYILELNLLHPKQSDWLYDMYHMKLVEKDNIRFDVGCKRLTNRVFRERGYKNKDKGMLNTILNLYKKKSFILIKQK